MPITLPAAGQRVILSNVTWETFLEYAKGPGTGGRLTYDQGILEVMSPSGKHEKMRRLTGRFIETMASTLSIEIASYGSTTLLLESLRRGLEPDECYYVQNEPQVRGKGDLDLTVDPPPDLVVEVDITSSSLDKFEIYRSLGVPEIWRFEGDELRIHLRDAGGKYTPCERSAAFPLLPLDGLQDFLNRWNTKGETSLMREFADWVRTWTPASGE